MTETNQKILLDALAFAEGLADQVGRLLVGYFGSVRDPELKDDGTLVTQADLAADQLIAEAIRRRYPDHDIISEELDTVYEGAPWCWIIDPLDGTTNFAQGVPIWSACIALAYAGWPVMGLVDLPTMRMRYHALKDGGAFENGRPIRVMPPLDWSNPSRLQNELFAVCSRTVESFTLDLPLKARVLGSAAYNFCLTAAGVSPASMDMTPKVWDIAAGWLLVHEAGGVVTQLGGDPMLPLVAGRDYVAVTHPQLSASSPTVLDELQRRMRRQ